MSRPKRKPVPEERSVRPRNAPLQFDDDTIPSDPPPGKRPPAADTQLRAVTSDIGAGGGNDEAEDARESPLDPREVKRVRQRIARAGGSLRKVEPNETGAGNPGRARNSRRR